MNLVFLIERQNFYKYFSSIIEEGLKRGHTVECWHDYTQPRLGMKDYLFPRIENSPFYNSGKNNLMFVKLKNEGDFQNHSLEFSVPALKNGRYILAASANEEFSYLENGISYAILIFK